MSTKTRVILAGTIVVITIVGLYSMLLSPSTNVVMGVKLNEVSTGSSTFASNNVTYHHPYADISLTFNLPLNMNPARLEFYVTNQQHEIPVFGGIVVSGINITYLGNSYPHWEATLPAKVTGTAGYWTGFTGIATNPDGRIVGGAFNNGSFIPGDSLVKSGALLHLTFPAGVSSVQGFSVTVIYRGSAIASTTLTVTVTQLSFLTLPTADECFPVCISSSFHFPSSGQSD